MDLNLVGKRALVSAGGAGLGRASAIELSRLGAEIVVAGRSENGLQETVGLLSCEHGQKHDSVVADYTDFELVKTKFKAYEEQNAPIHIVVNNSGGPPPGMILDAAPEDFQSAINMHLFCNQIIAQTFIAGMKRDGYGRIINIISVSVKEPQPNLGVSNTIRAAVAHWAKSLAAEVGQFGITVNNVLPGLTRTARLMSYIKTLAEQNGRSVEEQEQLMSAAIPLQYIGQPEGFGNAVAFLASPAASYITGVNLPVDGGYVRCL